MAKVSYTNLKLKLNNEVKEIEFNGQKIEVLQYLPIEEKYSLVNITLQKAREGAVFNPIKLDMYFHLNLIYVYTNINFTEKQREDEAKLYDLLLSSGLLDKIIEAIPAEEYDYICEQIDNLEEDLLNFDSTLASLVRNIIENLPLQAEEMQKIVDNFDPEKYQNVLDFAKSINGGREIQ